MATVELYTTPICPYCIAAKRLLDEKSQAYTDFDVMADPSLRAEMMQRANGRHTVPQIFIGETHVGGFDDIAKLEREGKLDDLLAS
ncbi:glutaredoxin 3 [Aliiroseovarius sp. PTFE2010]|uniref:glutaredoxin 3 n=1 Tax=Aliiroseovarius sp. PTFE2010 TaxID=3417190 RepID=UPI003CEACB8F